MADDTPHLNRIGNLYEGTLRLLSIATEIGDDFLQYIYRMALRDLEEKSGSGSKRSSSGNKDSGSGSKRSGSGSKRSDGKCGASHDPAIVELATQLRALASRKQ
jgi:hypothetical protein